MPVPAAQIGVTRIGHDRLGAELSHQPAVEEMAFSLAKDALASLLCEESCEGDLGRLVERRASSMLEAAHSFTDPQLLSVTLFIGQHNEVAFRAALVEL